MSIRTVRQSDYQSLVSLYAAFFKTHAIFQQSRSKVITYLQKQKDTLLVYDDQGIKGALFLVLLQKEKSHSRWKFRHFAFQNETVAASLLHEAEKRVRKFSKTVKIELTFAETEKGLDFYLSHGYRNEGVLQNHYRWGEKCYVVGKSFS